MRDKHEHGPRADRRDVLMLEREKSVQRDWLVPDDSKLGRIDTEAAAGVASHQVGLAFERTLMGADRTLMATVRTSLALIGFGFAICEVFRQLEATHVLVGAQLAGRRVGLGMLVLGILLLVMGALSHVRFFRNLDRRHRQLLDLGLLRGAVQYRPIPTFVTAALLFMIGVLAVIVVTAQLHR
jgi:putative membrane protein